MANSPAIIGTPTNKDVTEDTNLQLLVASGFIPISDANPGQAVFKTTVKSAIGTLGTLTIAANGAYTYSVANSAVQYLGANKTKVETFTVTSVDGTTKQVSFTIKGTNDAAVIGDPAVSQVSEDVGISSGKLKATGTLSISDADQGEASFQTTVTSVGSNLGTLTIAANGAYTYSVSNSATQYLGVNDTRTETFAVTALDGTTKQISFTIQGKNDVAVIGTPTMRNTSDTGGSSLTASGTISVSDVDQGQAAFNTTVAQGANLGTLSLNANGSYTYSVAKSAVGYLGAGATKTETFTITSVDGTSKQVSFVIKGINDAAVIGTPTVSNVTEDATAQPILYAFGSISITDPDAGEAAFKTALISGQGALGTLVLLPNGSYSYFVASSAVQHLGAGDTKIDTFTVTSKDGTTKQVSFTIHGTNDAAVIGTPTHRDVTANPNETTLTATGSISISDVDQNQASFNTTVVSAAGNFGNLVLNSNGTYTYSVPESAAEQLGIGGTKVDTFTVTSFDGTTKQVTFTVHGPTSANQPAVIGNPSVSSVSEDAAAPDITATGTISISDADAGEAAFQATVTSAAGNLGTLLLSSDGSYTYTVANSLTQSLGAGSTKVDTFTVTSLDGTTKQVTFTINGANDAAVITGTNTANLAETNAILNAGGTLSATDIDGAATFTAQSNVAGSNGYGHFSIDSAGVWTYSTDTAHDEFVAGQTYTDSLTVATADGTSHVITVSILGANDAAVITGTNTANLAETNAILSTGGTLSATDVDGAATFTAQSNVAGSNGYGHFSIDSAGAWTYSTDTAHDEFVAGQTYTDSLTVATADGTPQVITVSILGANDAAVITGTSTANLAETDAILNAGGTLSATDVDGAATFTAQSNVAGSNGYGHFSIDSAGVWTYSTDTARNEFAVGQTYTDSLTVTTADGTPQVITISILGAQDAPTLSVATASGLEDTAIPLTITSTLVDSGSTLALTITGVPAGVTLNHGTPDAGDSSIWHLSGLDLAGLALIPAPDFSGTINLSVTATSTDDASSSQLSTIAQTLTVNIAGVADEPDLAGPSTISEIASAAPIPLGLHLELNDLSETLSVTIKGVAGNYILSSGEKNDDGDWVITAGPGQDLGAIIETLTMLPGTPGLGAIDTFHLEVTATSSDGISTASTSIDVVVEVTAPEGYQDGLVSDGYISGATVFADANGNGTLDAGEFSTTTRSDGTFTLTGGTGNLVMFGGVDVSTGLEFLGVLSAPNGSTVVTPLTTLVTALVSAATANLDPQDPGYEQALEDAAVAAQEAIATAFGLEPSIDLQNFDPVQAAAAGDPNATEILAAGIQVQTTIAQITAAAGSATTGADVVSAVATAISDAGGSTVNLSDTTTLTSIIVDAAPSASTATINAATQIVSEANAAIASAASGTGDALDILTSLAQAATVALGQTTDALAAAAGTGDFTAAVNENTGGALTTAIQTAEVGDPDGSEVGTSGNDTISGAGGNDVIDGLDGNDTLSGLGGKDTIHGGNGSDTILGGEGDDKLYGDDGKDLLTGGAGDDIIDGGSNFDRATYADATGGITVNLLTGTVTGAGIGSDTLIAVDGFIGSDFDDHFDGAGFTGTAGLPGSIIGFSEFEGGGGDDEIIGATNTLGHALTRVSYLGASAGVTVDLQTGQAFGTDAADVANVGHDTISNILNVWGSNYDDILRGSDNGPGSFEAYEGRRGNDTIEGRGGYDVVVYATDLTTTTGITVNMATGTVTGDVTVGTDTLRQVEAVRGTNFNDLYDATNFGTAGTANIGSSGTFNDFQGGGGNDTVIGNGATRVNFSSALAGVTVNLQTNLGQPGVTATNVAGTATGATEGADTLTGVNAAQGSSFNDTLLGSNFNNTLTGLGGDDIIDGRGGFDTASYNSMTLSTGGIAVMLAAGTVTDNVSGVIGQDTLQSIEAIQGTHFADTFNATGYGLAGALNVGNNFSFNQFEGLGGNDTITGNGNTRLGYFNATAGVTVVFTGSGSGTAVGNASVGTDTFTLVNSITGSGHGDSITGDGTNNAFDGGAGDDTINGGGGSDTITGGAGNDTIEGGSGFADMAVYTGARNLYTINLTGAGVGSVSGPDGSDTFTGIEVLQFSNQYLLTTSGLAGSPVNVTGLNFIGGVAVGTLTGTGDDFLTIGQQLSNRLIDLGGGTGDTITLGVSGFYNLNLANVESLKGSGADDFLSLVANANGLAIDLGVGTNDVVNLAGGINAISVVNVESINTQDGIVGSPVSNDTLTLLNSVTGLTVNLQQGNNTLNLAAGANSLVNVFNINTINGTGSDDALTISNGINGSTVNLGGGTDTLILTNGFNTLGLSGVENVFGGTADDFVNLQNIVSDVTFDLGNGSNDTLTLFSGINSVGAVGVETINVNEAVASDDTLTLTNLVSGLSVNLGLGTNTINLAAGSNSLNNAFGTNIINGTSSGDTLTVVNGLYQSTVNLGDGTDTLILTNPTGFSTLGLVGVENVVGGTADDYIVLQNEVTDVTFDLGTGNDTLILANGSNSVGVVSVAAINGSDFGDPSDDTLTLLSNVTGININLGDGNNTLNLAAGTNSVQGYGLDTIMGTASADVLTTLENAQGSTIDLGADIDTLNLGVIATGVTVKNIENVNGSEFNDTITIANTSGTTTVTGGLGTDFITASAGQDNIRYTSAGQAGVGGGETVNDFNAAVDTIVLDHVAGLAGDIHFVNSGVFTGTPGNSEARLLNGNVLQIDLDGDGAGDMEITLNGLTGTLTDDSFVTSGVNHAPSDISLLGSSVAENSAVNTVVGTLSASDPDAGDTFTFSIVNPNGMFAISGNNLVVAGPIDYEAGASQQVTVRVTDASGATKDEVFSIGVTDVNDAPTVNSGATGTVAENAATSTVVYQATASDPDAGDTIVWSLSGGTDAAAFTIDTNGQVTLNSSADYEAKSSYSINVVATDGGNLFSTKAVTISVTDVNEAPTNIALSGNSIAEGSANGAVVGTLSDTDPDAGDSATYMLTDNAGGRFAVLNGQIIVAGALDFETATSHQITVQVTDGGNNTFTKNFTIGVTDVAGVTSTGGANGDTLVGTSEADTLNGLGGNDLLKGLAGNDALDGGLGFDRADYSDATGGITVNMAAGTVTGPGVGSDTLVGIEAVTGSNFADTFNGAGFTGSTGVTGIVVGQDDFEGGGGDDTIIGTVNALGQMTTRATYVSATSGVTVDLGAGTADGDLSVGHDTLSNVNSIVGSNHNDTFTGSDNAAFTYETYEGRAGNDFIDGRGGFDQVNYQNDPATTSGIVVQLAAGTVTGDASVGTDTLSNVEAVRGTIHDDIFNATGFGSAGATNVSSGGAFNDFGGAAGNDTIIGNGSTRLNYQSAASSVSVDLETSAPGTTGVTVAGVATSATEGTDSFTGVNAVQGSMYGDTLLGSSFNNTLTGLGGDDFIDGYGGFDTAGYNSLSTVTSGVTVNMGAGTASGDASIGTDTLRDIEAVQGTMLADSYNASTYGTGGALNVSTSNGTYNQFEGLSGNDTITGNGNTRLVYTNAMSAVTVDIAAGTATGDTSVGTDIFSGVNSVNGSGFGDTLQGDVNNEVFLGLAGDDEIDGRGGFDTALYSGFNTTAGVTVDMASGVVTGNTSVGTDTLLSIESVQGTNFGDSYVATGYGEAGALNVSDSNGNFNQFQGLAGDDTITGNGNTQISYSNASGAVDVNLTTGIATGNGSVGTDTITGGVFNVFGSNFNDTIVGTASADSLSGGNGNDTITGGAGNDVLTGGAGADRLVFATGAGADTITDFVPGDQLDLTGVNGIFSFADVQANATQVGLDTLLTFGSDSITLKNVTASNLVAGDFIFGAIIGDANANTLFGTSGDDTIQGLGGSDRLQGMDGNDTLDGGQGFDRAGYSDATGGITANLAAGTVSGAGVGNDTLINVEGIVGSAHNDTLNAAGFSGDTGIAGTAFGFNEIEGGGGDDTITSAVNSQGALLTKISYANAASAVTVDLTAHTATGGDGNDTLFGAGFANVVGSGHADQLLGSTNANGTVEVFEGRAGNDTINGRTGFDRADYAQDPLAQGVGITVNLAAGQVIGDATLVGTDTLISVESVRGTNSADTFNASGFSGTSTNAGSNGTFNEFNGMGGNDTITGNGATRVTYVSATGGVTVNLQTGGTAGTGTASGDASTGDDTFTGVNAIQASMFNDTLSGSDISNNLAGLGGNDFIDGRGGFDTANYYNVYFSTGAITVDFAAGTVTGDASVGSDTLRGIEGVQGTNFNDVFVATNFGTGAYSDTSLYNVGNAGFGNFNQFEGLGGNDAITGNGNTRLIYSGAADAVTINLLAGTATGGSTIGSDTFVGVNSATGSNSNDTYNAAGFTGITSAGSFGTFNLFEGLAGDDTITGNGNTRVSYSQAGGGGVNVSLASGVVSGVAGADFITGGVNSVQSTNQVDILTGGSSDESFFAGGGGDTINAGDGNDGITGQGGSDTIDGGNGTDMVSFTGAQGGYTINFDVPTAGKIQVVDGTANRDFTDVLSNVEVLAFSDAILLLSSGTAGTPIDISTQQLTGNSTVTGTNGDDYLRIGSNIFGHQINLGAGAADTVTLNSSSFGSGFTLNLFDVENVTGSSSDEFVNLMSNANGLIIDLGGGNDNLGLAGGTNTLNITGVDSIGGSDFGATPGVNDVLNLLSTVSGLNISLGNGDNTINLAAGANSFTNIYDINHVNGTTGDDTLTIAGALSAANGSTVDLGDGEDRLVLAGNFAAFSAVGIEYIDGSASDNQLSLASIVSGIEIDLGGGADSVSLASGVNSLSIVGVEDLGVNDFLVPSDDTVSLLNAVSGVTVNLGMGTANTLNLAAGNNSFDNLWSVNLLNGSSSDDTLTLFGNPASTIDLGDGNDTLNFTQTAFNVTVVDVENVNGSANFDTMIIGGNSTGITTVTAGVGGDAITGSAGQENFRFTSVGDSTINGVRDTITDFDASNDTFTFEGIAYNGDHIEYVGTSDFSGSGQAEARYLTTTPGHDMLQIDLDGDGVMTASDMEIGVASYTGTLQNSNFLLV
ncbi:VCBS domain-containing protein [Bradyrhizobium sp. LjRoot220]|uniref:VCBS domain-containing protein n=1 Tax=Bradyrhizobium sp. LjRoot220 TaxID=3342284 RepID=UPI003ECD3B02